MKNVLVKISLIFMIMISVMSATLAEPVHASDPFDTVEQNLLGDNHATIGQSNGGLVKNIVRLIGIIARVVGVILGAFGLFKTVLAMKDQDSNGITTGIILVAVAAALLFLPSIITAVMGI